jgi:cytochrome c peroxidase
VFGPKEVLGQALFFDPFVSGPKQIACGTCHVRSKATGDGLRVAIALGGGDGVGTERISETRAFLITRNALPFFNRGSGDFLALFWDGRVQLGEGGRFESPLGDRLPSGFDSLLAVAAALPLAESDEMLGRSLTRGGSNKTYHGELVDGKVYDDNYLERTLRVYPRLLRRLVGSGHSPTTPTSARYQMLFSQAYRNVAISKLGMPEIGNALAAYISIAFELQSAPWDRYLLGDSGALSAQQKRGALIFLGKGRCAVCHSKQQFSDFEFHSLAIPQYEVGKHGAHIDYGRAAATGRGEDRFKFRTPPLRNVMKTGPWGHNGVFDSVRQAIEHHFNPIPFLWKAQQESPQEAAMAGRLLGSRSRILSEIDPLTPADIDDLLAFVAALSSDTVMTDERALPNDVPSGMNQFIRK